LRSLDDGYESDRAAANTKKLIEDGVFLLFGYVGTPTSNASKPIFTAARVPFVGPFTGAESLRNPLNRYIFNIRASYYDETDKLVAQLVGQTLDRVAVFYQNDDYGKAGLAGVERAMQKRNLKIIATGTVETTPDDGWDEMIDINLRAPFRLMRAAVPLLAASRGSVVNVSSVTGLRAFPGVLAYCVSKAGVDQLTRCAALELAPQGVRVNAVNPGVVVTNLHRRSGIDEESYAAFLERSKQTHPLGRAGDAAEIAELIVFLASERAVWITGETISIDGGRHLTCAR